MTTQSVPGHGRPDPGLSAVMSERRQLINLTYRLLGSLVEAEDAVQETDARWYAVTRQQQEAVESPAPEAPSLDHRPGDRQERRHRSSALQPLTLADPVMTPLACKQTGLQLH